MMTWVNGVSVWSLFLLLYITVSYSLDLSAFGNLHIPDVNSDHNSIHGGVKMGVLDDTCDNGKDRIDVDLSMMSEMTRKCPPSNRLPVPTCKLWRRDKFSLKSVSCKTPEPICTKRAHRPIHQCMDKVIVYKDDIPTSGAHRPIWPVYGEYDYLPPQRWIHSLEHGAAVFLYHPCVDHRQLDVFRSLATSCLRRHIITPYNLTQDKPFAILTWTCRMMLDRVDIHIPAAVDFLRDKALQTYESNVYQDGDYKFLLKKIAKTVTDKQDYVVCP
ncbi:uncharacterized protein LOC132560887 [Ylistrum balloti]|uniref:uncharacterized protein LOC132560887 n=1 Tax=Ylistrum balloti TaxID=509963 RepID=UPI002905A71C|nr:uncharacterized protein LOC132560887 [Ylistrum balloti]